MLCSVESSVRLHNMMYSFHRKYNLVTVKECKLYTEADEQGCYEKTSYLGT